MKIVRIVALGVVAAGGVMAHADYAFNDFNNNFGYDISTGFTVSGAGNGVSGVSNVAGMQFTAADGGSLSEIDIAAEDWDGTNSLTATLYSDSSGVLGTQLGAWTVTGEMLGAAQENSIVSFVTTGSGISLTQGTAYWVVATASNPSTFASWSNNELNIDGNYFFNTNNTGNQYHNGELAAYDVVVQSTPEPASLAMLGLGALVLLKRRRKR